MQQQVYQPLLDLCPSPYYVPHAHRVLHRNLGPVKYVYHLVVLQHVLSELLVYVLDLLEPAHQAVLVQDYHD